MTIASFATQLVVITSKQRPRKLTIHGSDGEDYAFLLKGHEDLRQDERVMQVLYSKKLARLNSFQDFSFYIALKVHLFYLPLTNPDLLTLSSYLVWLIRYWTIREKLLKKIFPFNDMMLFHYHLIVD